MSGYTEGQGIYGTRRRSPMKRRRTNCEYCGNPGKWIDRMGGKLWANHDGQEHRCIEYRQHRGITVK